jgi:hypothetical protein
MSNPRATFEPQCASDVIVRDEMSRDQIGRITYDRRLGWGFYPNSGNTTYSACQVKAILEMAMMLREPPPAPF